MNGIEGVKAKRRQRVTETRATEQRDFIRGVSPPPPLPSPAPSTRLFPRRRYLFTRPAARYDALFITHRYMTWTIINNV